MKRILLTLTALLKKTRRDYGDAASLHVDNPAPAAWTPATAEDEQPKRERAKGK
jgi:hypothetical protein